MVTSGGGQLDYGVAPPGYRLPAATRLGPVELQVADVERSIAYYERVIGLRRLARTTATATLGPDGSEAPLVLLRERRGAAPVPRRGRLGLYHFALLLPERASLGRFVAHLREMGVAPGMSDHLVSEAIYLTDPDGLGIEVYADRPRSAWRQADGQLVMATEPLEVDDLLAAAAETRWEGAPAGTVIGHVHLFVGDLDRAAGFYHAGLGFDKMVWSYPGALFLGAGGYHHHLGTNTWAAGAPIAGSHEARLQAWNVVLPTPGDVAAALDSVEQAGAQVARALGGGLATDPWGTAVRVTHASVPPTGPP